MCKSKIIIIMCFFIAAVTVSGCASLKETAKGIAGLSTKQLVEKRDKALKKEFKLEYNDCYEKILKILNKIGSYVYAKDKEMVAVYVSEEDTTCAGIFLVKVDNDTTRVEVSSASTYAKEFIAGKLFFRLDNPDYMLLDEVTKEEE